MFTFTALWHLSATLVCGQKMGALNTCLHFLNYNIILYTCYNANSN